MARPISVNWMFAFFCFSLFVQIFYCSSISGISCYPPSRFILSLYCFILLSMCCICPMCFPSFCALSTFCTLSSFCSISSFCVLTSFCALTSLCTLTLYLGFFLPKLHSKMPIQHAPKTHLWLVPTNSSLLLVLPHYNELLGNNLSNLYLCEKVASFFVNSSMACAVKY
jgi:hypothetical protein